MACGADILLVSIVILTIIAFIVSLTILSDKATDRIYGFVGLGAIIFGSVVFLATHQNILGKPIRNVPVGEFKVLSWSYNQDYYHMVVRPEGEETKTWYFAISVEVIDKKELTPGDSISPGQTGILRVIAANRNEKITFLLPPEFVEKPLSAE